MIFCYMNKENKEKKISKFSKFSAFLYPGSGLRGNYPGNLHSERLLFRARGLVELCAVSNRAMRGITSRCAWAAIEVLVHFCRSLDAILSNFLCADTAV